MENSFFSFTEDKTTSDYPRTGPVITRVLAEDQHPGHGSLICTDAKGLESFNESRAPFPTVPPGYCFIKGGMGCDLGEK